MTKRNRLFAKKRAKRTSPMVCGDDNDRISKLPDALIIHILSFLPTKDVVETCILSKRWKLVWYSVPTLFFSRKMYGTWRQRQGLNRFYNYVSNCLEHRKKGMNLVVDSGITSFKIDMTSYYQRHKARILDKWLGFAVENKVKEMYLFIGRADVEEGGHFADLFYCLPKILDNARYLTSLELYGVMLDTNSCSFSFPFLKTLSLKDVWNSEDAEEDGVVKFLLGCPSIEKLLLHDYYFFEMNAHYQLQSLSLKFMELIFQSFGHDAQIQVEATNLESLVVEGIYIPLNDINFSSCEKIRNLSLSTVYFENNHLSSFEALISDFPLIENLALNNCNLLKLEHLKISSQHLKSFHLRNCHYSRDDGEMMVVTIESAPKLAYFCYEGYLNFSISMESSSNLVNGEIMIRERVRDYGTIWFIDMMNFLVNLKCPWNIVTLHVSTYEALICPPKLKNICRYSVLNWKHLRVITYCPPEKELDLKEALMWIAPSLETLSINEKVQPNPDTPQPQKNDLGIGEELRSKAGLLDKWLGFAVENRVKEMYVSIGQRDEEEGVDLHRYFYRLPKVLLDNVRYLTIFELYGVKLDTSHSFSFPSLKTLSLKYVLNSKDAE
ncbi:hypothetical protein CsatB_028018 [Cannabis sativa]